MLTFHVPDISCQHCVATITDALVHADASAKVQIDVESKAVRVDSAKLDAEAAAMAIVQAGYTVEVSES